MSKHYLPSYLHTAPILSAGPAWANLEWQWELPEGTPFQWAATRVIYPKAYLLSAHQQTRVFGAGAFKTLPYSAEEAAHFWEEIKNHPNSFLIGGQTFFSSPAQCESKWDAVRPHYYFLPRIYFRQAAKGGLKIGLNFSHQESMQYQETGNLPFDFLQFFATAPEVQASAHGQFFSHESTPNKNQWSKLITQFTGQKVVYARRLSLRSDQPTRGLLENKWHTSEDKATGNIFWLDLAPEWFFLSFSPERLFSLQKDSLTIDVLAGTTRRGQNAEEDQALAHELLQCDKNRQEHQFVLNEIRASLGQLGLKPELLFSGKILKLPHVQHLHSLWQSEVNQQLSPFSIIKALHPTPAVGGHPRATALVQIAEGEGYERGLYAAPVGILSAGWSEILVAIRSALSEKEQLHVFAGAGIVRQSDAEMEWQETAHKMKNFVGLELGNAP